MRSHLNKIVLIVLFVVAMPYRVVAQQIDDLDYLKYKFYDDDEDLLWWLAEDVDSISNVREQITYNGNTNHIYYNLRGVQFSQRGIGYAFERHIVEGLDVDYTTVRLLQRLGIQHSGDALRQNYPLHILPRYRNSERLEAHISGRGYLASLGYKGAYQLSPHGIRLNEDWQLTSYVGINLGDDIYIDGVARDAVDFAISAQRKWINNSIFIAAMLPWSLRSEHQYSTAEAYRLLDNPHYNPAWGMQSGKRRSSRLRELLRPEIVASWQRRLSAWTDMTLTFRCAYEHSGRSSLAWFDAQTPEADNYRKMPSYFSGDEHLDLYNAWHYNDLRYTQIDWDRLYHTNALQSDGHAAFILENRRTNSLLGDTNLRFITHMRGFDLEYGAMFDIDSEHRFKIADDMLGADHILNIDYFIIDDERHATQYRNNLRDDNLVVHEGDRFGYDYRLTSLHTQLFCRARWSSAKMDFEVGTTLGHSLILRRGYYEKELFDKERSYGASRSAQLNPSSIDISWAYAIGNNHINALFELRSETPEVDAIFLQPNYNNRIVESLHHALTLRVEAGYARTTQRLRLNATLFVVHRANESAVVRYYDDIAQEYSDAVIGDIVYTNLGAEVSASCKWTNLLSSQFNVIAGSYRYTRDAHVTTYADSDNKLIAKSTARMRGCRMPYPQLAAYGDIKFQHAGWSARASLQFWGYRYVDASYIRRTERILSYAPSPEERDQLFDQQRLDDALSLGIQLSKNLHLGEHCRLYVSLAIDNLLNSNIIYGGYEQNRIRRISSGYYTSTLPFDNKLRYAYGRTFRLSISFSF